MPMPLSSKDRRSGEIGFSGISCAAGLANIEDKQDYHR